MKLNYKKMVAEIDELTNTDFLADMNMKNVPPSKKYTHEEARKMEQILSSVYLIAHGIHCKTCGKKYLVT